MQSLAAERLERAVDLTARMLVGRDVTVTHRGAKAFVEWDKNYNVKRINIPSLPNDASPELISALQGYLDHEVGHVFNTDPELYQEAQPKALEAGLNAKLAALFTNVIEDTRIERLIEKEFPGARYNLDAVRKAVFVTMGQKALDRTPKMDERRRRSIALVPYFRARAGQFICQEWMDKNDLWHLFADLDEAFPDMSERLTKIKWTDDAVNLALEVLKAIASDFDPPPDDSEDGEGEKGDGDGKTSKGKSKTKSKDKGKSKDKDKPEEKPEDDDAGSDPSSAGTGEGETEKDATDKYLDPEAVGDFDEDAAKAIEEALTSKRSEDPVRDYSRDWDEIVPAPADERAPVSRMEEAVDKTSAAMRKDLQRLIAARSMSVRVPGFRSGRLHPASLQRLTVGDDRAFSRRQENRTKDVAVSLLVDLSGSMNGEKVKVAMEAAWAFSDVLSSLKINNEVLGFTSDVAKFVRLMGDRKVKEDYEDFCRKTGVRARLEPIYMPIYKAFNEPFSVMQKRRMATALYGPTRDPKILHENHDGHAVRYAAMRLLEQKQTRKVMLVFSDGFPAASACGDLNADLKKSVKTLNALKIETVGIGIMSNAVKTFYPKHVVIEKVSDLASEVMGQLRTILAPV